MSRAGEAHLREIRRLATRFVSGELPLAERDRAQRMLTERCGKLAVDSGLNAQTLYWAAIHYAEGPSPQVDK